MGSLTAKMANAAMAGVVASFVQAFLFAITEPIVNRVNVQRMTIVRAMKAVTPAMMTKHFRTTLPTSLLKGPFYEVTVTLAAVLPISANMQGLLVGILFTTIMLPITNFRARMSLQQEFKMRDMYVAYWPTVIRDIAGGVARTKLTKFGIETLGFRPQSPDLMFGVVLMACWLSAPFNEWRGYMLQKGKSTISFGEFFQPINCIRSTMVGAFNFALALGAGYWVAPGFARVLHLLVGR